MPAVERHKSFRTDASGAALIEFTLVAWFFFVAIFGIVEFALYFWQYGAISKGAQAALRYAVVSDPVTGDWDALVPVYPFGDVVFTCRSSGTGSASCTPAANPANSDAMDCIIQRVQAFAPFVEPENVVIEYSENALGLPGAYAPTIRISFENLQFMTIFLGFMAGRMLPALDYSMTAEDASSSSPGSLSSSSDCGLKT
jgi:hypothetical protein